MALAQRRRRGSAVLRCAVTTVAGLVTKTIIRRKQITSASSQRRLFVEGGLRHTATKPEPATAVPMLLLPHSFPEMQPEWSCMQGAATLQPNC